MNIPTLTTNKNAAVLLSRTYVFAAFGGAGISHFGAKCALARVPSAAAAKARQNLEMEAKAHPLHKIVGQSASISKKRIS